METATSRFFHNIYYDSMGNPVFLHLQDILRLCLSISRVHLHFIQRVEMFLLFFQTICTRSVQVELKWLQPTHFL